ncbi:hypothetical protein JCM19000A_41440 [Silvimonas sp. JCM 19000]
MRNSAMIWRAFTAISLTAEAWVAAVLVDAPLLHDDLRNHRACRVVFDALVTGLREYAASA